MVGVLAERRHRFGEPRGHIGGISQKMLTRTLRGLERDGLVSRTILATSPVSVEYALTPLGTSLVDVFAAVGDWAERHIAEVVAAREVAASASTSVN